MMRTNHRVAVTVALAALAAGSFAGLRRARARRQELRRGSQFAAAATSATEDEVPPIVDLRPTTPMASEFESATSRTSAELTGAGSTISEPTISEQSAGAATKTEDAAPQTPPQLVTSSEEAPAPGWKPAESASVPTSPDVPPPSTTH